MTIVDYRNDPATYARLYAELDISGTQFLAFRDLPELIKRYVSGSKVLDYGSGAGKSSMYLKKLGFDVHGVDINEEMVKNAFKADPAGKYELIESAKIPAEACDYDMVFCSWVLMEVPTKEQLLDITNEIARVLKKQGIFVAVMCNEDTYNTDWISENTQFEENQNLTSGSIVKMHFKDLDLTILDYFWSESDYYEAICSAGMEIIEVHKPLGKINDGYNWINEHKKSPCSIYIARKTD